MIASLYVVGVVVVKGFLRCTNPEEGAPSIKYQTIEWDGLVSVWMIISRHSNGEKVFVASPLSLTMKSHTEFLFVLLCGVLCRWI